MPELKPALRFLMQAFENDVEAEWCRGLQSWLIGLRDDVDTRSLAWPSKLLTDEINRKLINCRDASTRTAGASKPTSYRGNDFPTRRNHAITYAATARAVADLTATMGRNSLFEVAHNAAFFAHLASTLWTYRALEECQDNGPVLHWADLASEKVESDVGGDFAFIVPIDERRCKLAIVQAKREDAIETIVNSETGMTRIKIGSRFADIRRPVGELARQQFDILLLHEAKQKVALDRNAWAIFGAWCFYAFWHRPDASGAVQPPLVRSARDIKERAKRGSRDKDHPLALSRIPTTPGAVDLTTFLALHLPDPGSGVGLVCDCSDLPELIGITSFNVRTIALMSSPDAGWPLGYWTSLIKVLPGYVDMTPVHRTASKPAIAVSTRPAGGATTPNRR